MNEDAIIDAFADLPTELRAEVLRCCATIHRALVRVEMVARRNAETARINPITEPKGDSVAVDTNAPSAANPISPSAAWMRKAYAETEPVTGSTVSVVDDGLAF
jgi:hypothetical protein